jgi:vitamin B12 transporter
MLAPAARAQQAVDDSVVVTASRIPQAEQDVVPATTVLTRQDIEREQTTDLVELLGRQPGIEFAQLGGPGRQASVFLRGANSNQVLVLVDGVPLNSALDGAPAFGRLTTDFIERIEIVRGNLSSLYGSSAVGGVIQIFTRAPQQPGAQAQVEYGERDTRTASAGVGTAWAGLSLAASAGWREQNAVSAIDASQVRINPANFVLGANPATDPTRNSDGSLSLKYHASSDDLAAWT